MFLKNIKKSVNRLLANLQFSKHTKNSVKTKVAKILKLKLLKKVFNMAELLMWNANQYENGNFNNFVEATVKHELQYSHNQLATNSIDNFKVDLSYSLMNFPDQQGSPGIIDNEIHITMTEKENLQDEIVATSNERLYWVGLIMMPQGSKFIMVITGRQTYDEIESSFDGTYYEDSSEQEFEE
jgi:hypothetical protein